MNGSRARQPCTGAPHLFLSSHLPHCCVCCRVAFQNEWLRMFDYKLLPFKMQQQDHEAAQVSQELCGGDVGR